jgi:hypothetical protein
MDWWFPDLNDEISTRLDVSIVFPFRVFIHVMLYLTNCSYYCISNPLFHFKQLFGVQFDVRFVLNFRFFRFCHSVCALGLAPNIFMFFNAV